MRGSRFSQCGQACSGNGQTPVQRPHASRVSPGRSTRASSASPPQNGQYGRVQGARSMRWCSVSTVRARNGRALSARTCPTASGCCGGASGRPARRSDDSSYHARHIVPGGPSAADQRLNDVLVGLLEQVVAAQHLRHLPEQRPELPPLERDFLEAQDRQALGELALQPRGVELQPGRRQPGLDTPLHHEELDLHVDGAGEFGLGGLELPECGQLRGVGPLGPGTVYLRHRVSLASVRAPALRAAAAADGELRR